MKRHTDRQGNEDDSIPLPNIPLPDSAGLAARANCDVVMTLELERLLDEGLENLEQARTTDELRHRA